MQGVILAAGRGTRLGVLTQTRTKAMLPILGRPLVRWVLDSLAPLPVAEWLIVARPEDAEIASYFEGETREAPVRLVYQPESRGMADALNCAAPYIRGDFVLSACDNLAPEADIQRFLTRWQTDPRPDALLALLRMTPEEIGRSSAVFLEGLRVTHIIEKPGPGEATGSLASLPLYLFTPAILNHLEAVRPSPRGEYELQDALTGLIAAGAQVAGLLFSARETITSPADLLALNRRYLVAGSGYHPIPSGAIGSGTRLVPPVCIEPGARIGTNCVIGPEVYLERGCQGGNGVHLERAVVLRSGKIPSGKIVIDQVYNISDVVPT